MKTLFALVIATLAVGAQDGVSLVRKAKVGDTTTYLQTISFKSEGESVALKIKATENVEKIESGMITSAVSQLYQSVTVAGETMEIGEEYKYKSIAKATGEFVSMEGDMIAPEEYRVNALLSVVVPDKAVAPKDKWATEGKANSEIGLVPYKCDYSAIEFATVAGTQCVRIEFKGKESEGDKPMEVNGSAWLSTADGRLIKMDVAVKNLNFDEEVTDAKILLELQK